MKASVSEPELNVAEIAFRLLPGNYLVLDCDW